MDETKTLSQRSRGELIYDGMVFLTEYTKDGGTYGGSLIARDIEHAKQRVADRGLGETLIGKCELIIDEPSSPKR